MRMATIALSDRANSIIQSGMEERYRMWAGFGSLLVGILRHM